MLNDKFVERHLGPRKEQFAEMLKSIGVNSFEELIDQTIPQSIILKEDIVLKEPKSEFEILTKLQKLAAKNSQYKTYIGLGYYGTIMPPVIQRNVFENPAWYTSYTPYQAEISQGRLEALLNFQTAICELTGMQVANSSLLDEATSAAEAMRLAFESRSRDKKKANANKFFIDKNVLPQTIAVIKTRAIAFDIQLVIDDFKTIEFDETFFGAIVQYPTADGEVYDYSSFAEKIHNNDSLLIVAADILSLAILNPPAKWGADIVVGSSQRLGLPMAFGGPHTGYFATSEKYIRKMPGRIIGISKDKNGKPAYRMTLQTREQHIKREKATSNICTAQALMAILSSFYAVYHGYEGLKNIAEITHRKAVSLNNKLMKIGFEQVNKNYFDTLKIKLSADKINILRQKALRHKINFRYENDFVGISIDELTSIKDLNKIVKVFAETAEQKPEKITDLANIALDSSLLRTDKFMQQDLFKKYRSETEMMRYIKRLERKDISLAHSMISLGSCTMKLNPAAAMIPLSYPGFGNIHPFVPQKQAKGYLKIINSLKKDLLTITGMSDISFQPNSGAAGEHAGLSVIKAYLNSKGESHRNIMLIPASAHGTNPASSVMAGFKVVVIKTSENGNIDVEDLKKKVEQYKENLGGLMVTYPSTHGVFESEIINICNIIHDAGGQVYMDGANMNAQIGYTNPATIGADVCHLNLHKTFAMPHGGGGPGVGPIAVKPHLAPFLPTHPVVNVNPSEKAINPVAAAPYGSAMLLPISYAYVKMLGTEGLKQATAVAILNANYIASKLDKYFPVLYKGENGRVAHELILDLRKLKHEIDISELDVAKRLMDYGYHAPTVSFPVHGTLMVEPTESESKEELDRFIDAMISIYNEIEEIRNGKADKDDNVLKNAPHPEYEVVSDNWQHKYSREKAAYALPSVRQNKFWFNVARVDDAFGDRNLICTYQTPEFLEQKFNKK